MKWILIALIFLVGCQTTGSAFYFGDVSCTALSERGTLDILKFTGESGSCNSIAENFEEEIKQVMCGDGEVLILQEGQKSIVSSIPCNPSSQCQKRAYAIPTISTGIAGSEQVYSLILTSSNSCPSTRVSFSPRLSSLWSVDFPSVNLIQGEGVFTETSISSPKNLATGRYPINVDVINADNNLLLPYGIGELRLVPLPFSEIENILRWDAVSSNTQYVVNKDGQAIALLYGNNFTLNTPGNYEVFAVSSAS